MVVPKERLALLEKVQKSLQFGKWSIRPDLPKFGFQQFDILKHADLEREIKGFPCVAYNSLDDDLKFGIKVNPMERDYDPDLHPARMEAKFLQEFTRCVTQRFTPHVTFYFMDLDVLNSASALTLFPLKKVHDIIDRYSSVLISEFVHGGSIDDWVENLEEKNQAPTFEQWRYVIFSMIWTLVVLQDRFMFMHRDFHVGNILIDNTVPMNDKTTWTYTLGVSGDQKITFHVPSCGIVPKLWDLEFASVYKRLQIPPNPYGCSDGSRPNSFNPYYDLHLFLMSLLEVCNIPAIEQFITSIYPPELIPEGLLMDDHGSDCSTCSSQSTSGSCRTGHSICITKRSDVSSCSSCHETTFNDIFYYTDEEILSDTSSYSSCSSASSESSDSDSGHSSSYSSSMSMSSTSSIITPYLYGNRLRDAAMDQFKNIPSPLSLLSHPFFSCYRRKPNIVRDEIAFQYTLTSRVASLL